MEYEIIVPRLDWLIGGSRIGSDYNRYYGSLGTDPLKGCMSGRIFNYSVWMEKRENDSGEGSEVIMAGYHLGTKSFSNAGEEEITAAEFPAEEGSLEKIRNWLTDAAEKELSSD